MRAEPSQDELKALRLYRIKGKTQAEAYMAVHPNATAENADKHAYKYIRDAEAKLSTKQMLELYDLGPGRYMKEICNLLEAVEELTYKGFRTGDKRPDNQTRAAATKMLGQLNGVGEQHRTEITAEGGEGLHIIIDNG